MTKTEYGFFFFRFRLQGEKIASSFGYQVCKGDFNADGRDDLVVGTPFYFDKKKVTQFTIYSCGQLVYKIPFESLICNLQLDFFAKVHLKL